MYMYMYMYINMYMYMYIYVYKKHIYIYILIYVYVYAHICISLRSQTAHAYVYWSCVSIQLLIEMHAQSRCMPIRRWIARISICVVACISWRQEHIAMCSELHELHEPMLNLMYCACAYASRQTHNANCDASVRATPTAYVHANLVAYRHSMHMRCKL